jgi:hypothetical protein
MNYDERKQVLVAKDPSANKNNYQQQRVNIISDAVRLW